MMRPIDLSWNPLRPALFSYEKLVQLGFTFRDEES